MRRLSLFWPVQTAAGISFVRCRQNHRCISGTDWPAASIHRIVVFSVALAVSACASTENPDRLFPVGSEVKEIRDAQQDLAGVYLRAVLSGDLAKARTVRNEVIAQRMYAVDLQYSQYEAALTQESQKVGFAALTTAEGLSTAATIATSAATKSVLSGLTTAVIATKGHYDSEVLLALTMRTIQKQMRASRNKVAEHINRRMALSVIDYPLSAALSEVEDYYRAGTLTSGVIDTSTTVGEVEKETEENKQAITRLTLAARPAAVLPNDTSPILAFPTIPVLYPSGIGYYEQHLLPVRLAELHKALCVQPTGDPEVDLASVRVAAIKYLTDIHVKKDAVSNGITNRDRIHIMRNPKTCG